MNFYRLLKHFRKRKGMTQKEVADNIWIKDNTYSQYENEKRKVDIETYVKLADVLDIEIMAFSPKSEQMDEDFKRTVDLSDEDFKTWLNLCFDNEQIIYSLFYMDEEFVINFFEKMNRTLSKGRFTSIWEWYQSEYKRVENNSNTLRKSQFAREELLELLKKVSA